jgi:sigma-B regulation protein RsbQ
MGQESSPGNDLNILQRNNVQIRGEGGPVLIYGNGFGCNQTMWDRITPAFEASHTQVLFDYVGTGKSDLRAFDSVRYARLEGYAQDLLEVCDALGLQSDVTFVGHSVSCSIGLLACLERPALFKQLVLLGPSPCFLNDPPHYLGGFEREDLEGLLALMDQNFMGWASYLAPVIAGTSQDGVFANELESSFCSTDPVAARLFAKATFFSDNRGDLPKVNSPCLVLQHAQDSLAPLGVGDYVHQQLAGSTLKVLDVAGHCAHMSHPLLVIDAMRGYFLPTQSA